MNDDTAYALRTAANAAHERGNIAEASALFRKILELHPHSNEAADAVYYLTSGHRRPPQRVDTDPRGTMKPLGTASR
jgi:hypothetical protein